jgi:hypothetical protein
MLAKDQMTTLSSAAVAAVLVTSLAIPTRALGACKATLRGELVQVPDRLPARPSRFLFFYLSEVTLEGGTSTEKRLKSFQTFVVPNSRTTFPIPFAFDIDSPTDCPGELELRVVTGDTDQPPFSFGDWQLDGRKTIHLDKFESVPVQAVGRRF